jgi:hypothetical protein
MHIRRTPHLRFVLAAVTLIGLSAPSSAQTLEPFEVSPFAGYFIGGTIFDPRTPLVQSVSFANGATYGLRIGWNATPHVEPEFQWSRTESDFSPPNPNYLHSMDIDYFLGGASYNVGSGATRPYVSVDLGAARIDTIDYVPNTLFTISVGAGVKHFLTPHFGLRLDARGYASLTNDFLKSICTTVSGSVAGPAAPVPCVHDWFLNGDITGGVVFAF